MLGAIAGDVIGSVFERYPTKSTEFQFFNRSSAFTDDTVLTVAVAWAILKGTDYKTALRMFGQKYPDAGYGGLFYRWMFSPTCEPYNSWGNGSAMRVSPVGFAYSSLESVLAEAKKTAEVTHNHPEGIKGAQATALAIFQAHTGEAKETIRQEISNRFGYDLNRTVDEIRKTYYFDVSCQGSVPEAIISFLESEDFEDAIRKAISLGGDSDTLACMAGGIAQAYYKGVPPKIASTVKEKLPEEFVSIIDEFNERFGL